MCHAIQGSKNTAKSENNFASCMPTVMNTAPLVAMHNAKGFYHKHARYRINDKFPGKFIWLWKHDGLKK